MSATRVQALVVGLKMLVSLMPVSSLTKPPITICRPSASIAWPEQKMAENWFDTPVNAWLVGFQRRADVVTLVSHASHITILPVGRRAIWTSTNGQFMIGDHCPA